MNNQINEQYINKIYDDFITERNLVQNEIRNNKDPEDKLSTQLTKLKILENLITHLMKYRNNLIKNKSKN